MPKKEEQFFFSKKCKDVTQVSTYIFQGLFKNIVFRSLVLVRKFMGYFRFF